MSEAVQFHQAAVRLSAASRALALAELSKPRILGLVLLVTAVGYHMATGAGSPSDAWVLLHTLVGTACVAAGANALNQFLEAEYDARMTRTQERPIPSGRLTAGEALAFGGVLGGVGVVYLALYANLLAGLIAAVTLVTYVLVYTPLKRRTPLCVYVGAVPGALPPLIGWAAASGSLTPTAWVLFAILFFWQLPHFAAIAWQYREDYARAGYKMMSVVDGDGWRTNVHVVTHSVGLLAASLLPVWTGLGGSLYAAAAMLLGSAFFACGVVFLARRTAETARLHVLASVTYLPLLFGFLMIDRPQV